MNYHMRINSFLKFGYYMDYKNKDYELDLSNIDKSIYEDLSEEELIKIGKEKFIKAVGDEFEAHKKHVVPLSGGLDSRAILAALLEFTEAKNIYTYTFGTPKTFDYEIGCHIAEIAGTNHFEFPLNKYNFTVQELLDISRRINFQTILFHHPPVWQRDEIFKDYIVWSGYIGGELAGGHLPNYPSKTLKEAKQIYIEEKGYVNSVKIHNCNEYVFTELIDLKAIDPKLLTYDEQVDFNERQDKFIAPHTLIKGFKYKTPFINNSWMDFMFSIDNKYRFGQYLYRKILLNAFPRLFSYGTKTNYGLPIDANKIGVFVERLKNKGNKELAKIFPAIVNKGINYIDFNEGIRNRKDLNGLIYESIMDLKNRRVVDWINIDEIWNAHINKKGNFADALIVLASLEIHYKAEEEHRS